MNMTFGWTVLCIWWAFFIMKKIKLFEIHQSNKILELVVNEFISNPEINVLDIQLQYNDSIVIMVVYE